MIRFNSIFARLVFSHGIAIALTAIAMPAVLYILLASEVGQLHSNAMLKQAERLAQYIDRDAQGTLVVNLPAELKSQYSSDYGRYAYAIIDQDRKVLASSLKDGKSVFFADNLSQEPRSMSRVGGDDDISGISLPKTIKGQQIWIQTAEDLSHRDVLTDDIVADFIVRVGWIVLPVLVLLLSIDVALFRRLAKPLLHASKLALAIGPKGIDVRLPTRKIPNEILPLVQAVNQALDRLEQGFRVQREFTADAAHELRTPLAVMRSHIDTLPDSEAKSHLIRDVSRMAHTLGQMLDIAELDTLEIGDNETADLHQACIEVAQTLAPLAVANDKDIAFSGSEYPVNVNGNYEMIYRAIRNLAENAINHTPTSASAEIVVAADGTVSVLDDGPGLSEIDQDHLFRRFWRKNRRKAGSAGLGLAIVNRIAEIHGATINVRNRPSGGTEFSIKFRLMNVADHPSNQSYSMR